MRQVLTRNYIALPGHALKACLLYFGTFPRDHPIKTKQLLRRWLAEGFIEPQSSYTTPGPANYFDVLIDRNIIQPINVSNNEKVKTCQTYGMMHECILHRAIAQNFVTLFSDDKIEPRYVRRLSLHNSSVITSDTFDIVDLSLVRSLTIFGKACEAILDFNRYKLLRVLDLQKCDCLKDDHVKNISNMLLLKYLSLGANITQLPRDIGKLKELEVLDLRRTNVNTLPVEVFQIPCLVHLFGKFKLQDKVKPKCELLDFLSKERSNLQTLAGFAIDARQVFLLLHLISCMKKLRKLKIWWEPSTGANSNNLTGLQEVIQRFVKDENYANIGDRSLSLNFDKCSEDFLNSLKGPSYLSSLKLHGKLSALPEFIISLRGLKELSLSSAKLPKGLLEALTKLRYLKYLKLIADEIEKISIKDKEFPSLLRLCFVLQRPTFPSIEEGSMPFLITLQLFCKDLDGLSNIKIENLGHLKEVILDHRVAPDTWDEWKRAAKEHQNRPNVLLTKMTNASERELTEDCIVLKQDTLDCTDIAIASKASAQETDTHVLGNKGLESSAATKKHNSSVVQSSSDDELNSSSSIMGISEVSSSTESSKMDDTQNNLPEEVYGALELAKTESVKNSDSSYGSVLETYTQMSDNKGLESTIVQRIGELDSAFKDTVFQDDSHLTVLSETTGAQERESLAVTLEHSKTEPLENTVAIDELIRKTKTQIHVKQSLESTAAPKKQALFLEVYQKLVT